MAQGAGKAGSHVAADPEKIRAEMAKIRAALTHELSMLKSRIIDTLTSAQKKERTVTQKKDRTEHPGKKTAKKTAGHSRGTSKVVGKTKEVLSDVLAGAAKGAVKGAIEAVTPNKGRARKEEKASK